jgi:hypothetical protein
MFYERHGRYRRYLSSKELQARYTILESTGIVVNKKQMGAVSPKNKINQDASSGEYRN